MGRLREEVMAAERASRRGVRRAAEQAVSRQIDDVFVKWVRLAQAWHDLMDVLVEAQVSWWQQAGRLVGSGGVPGMEDMLCHRSPSPDVAPPPATR